MAREFRLFAASPGDVEKERDTLHDVVNEINQTHGKPLNYSIELVRWETHVTPGAGRPQAVITQQIGDYDIFVGIMWKRFGTPTGVAGSGTEEEFSDAYRRWQKNQNVAIMFYFCQNPFMPTSGSEIEQMGKVMQFREVLQGKALIWEYTHPDEFPNKIRKHICLRMNSLMDEIQRNLQSKAKPDEDTLMILRKVWSRMSPDLRNAFSIAYNENRQAGDGGIKTRDLFAAISLLKPDQTAPILQELPQEAMPDPISGSVVTEQYIIDERPWLSHCISSSIKRLGSILPEGDSLDAEDIFTDIAKNGSGQSVRQLRENNIGPDEIDAILKKKNVSVIKT